MKITLTILGEPASKANSRELATIGAKMQNVIEEEDGKEKIVRKRVGGRTIFRKSDKALEYERDALRQIPPACRVQLQGPIKITLRIYYATRRSDLDESLILDVLQDRYQTVKLPNGEKRRDLVQRGVYVNDRQIDERHVYRSIDKHNPRAEIEIEELEQQLFETTPAPAPRPPRAKKIAAAVDAENPF